MTLRATFPSASVLRRLLCASFALALIVPGLATATVPSGSGFAETLVANGLSNPTSMAFAPDGRLFVTQQGGQLRVIKNGALLGPAFLTLNVDSSGERGLLGVAFDPSFASNHFVYVYYTVPGTTNPPTPAHNRVSHFTASTTTDTAMPGTEVPILDLDNLSTATNHNGGAIHFGPDGKLYVAVGENANGANSQSLGNRLGKILRINGDGSIPADNPTTFPGVTGSPSGLNRAIWAIGLRNPYTFAFQPGTTRMFINDVGEGTWEEIDDGIAGSNYGWNISEGPTTDPRFRAPLYYYGHNPACAITGGTFYDPSTVQFPADYVGDYFFADFCAGWIRKFDIATGTATDFASSISNPVDLQVGSDGSLYYLARGAGSVIRISYTASVTPPTIVTHPANQAVSVGQSATFSVSATGTPPLTYQWQRNDVDIPSTNSPSYTIASAQLSDNGAHFRVRVSNSAGSPFSNEATLTVTSAPPPGPGFVKLIGNATLQKSGNTTLAIPVPAGGVAAGHAIVVAVTAGTFAGTVACHDSKRNVYTVDADLRATGRVFVCSARNVTALVPGDSITATYPGFSGITAGTASEFSGISTVAGSATRSGNSAAPSVNVSATANDLVVGAVIFGATPSFSAGCGFTLAGEASGGGGSGRKVVDAEWQVATSTSVYSACGTLTAPRPWQAAAVTYRP